MKRAKKDSDYRYSVFFRESRNALKMDDKEMWMLLWNENIGRDSYDINTVKCVGNLKIDDRIVFILEHPDYPETEGVMDMLVFKEHEGEYFPVLPQIMAVLLKPELWPEN